MKKIINKLSLLATLVLMLIMSCSKSEEVKPSPVAIAGGEIYRSQIVTVILPDITLTENEYPATLGGVTVTLTKLDVHKFLLPVSFAIPLGSKDLVIPLLNNLTIRYDVKDPVLTASAEVTMEPFITKLTTYSQSLGSSPNSLAIQKSIVSFNAVYANLTPVEKTEMAILYKTNKDIIDSILIGDFSKFNKRSSANDNIITLFVLHKAAVLGIAAGAVLFELGVHPGVKALGAVLAGVSTGFAIEHFGNIITNRCVALGTVFDGIIGTNNRISNSAATSISFQTDVEKTINFNTNNRTLNSSDSNKTQSDLASFFENNTRYNKIIGILNDQITWVNNNVILANFSLLPLEVMPTTSSTTNIVVNQTIFNKIKFTVSDPNLSLISSSLLSDGQLSLKIKIIGTPTTLPVDSFLNYSYSDDFSTFSGKLPIRVIFNCSSSTLAVLATITKNSATATATGGQQPYAYNWSNGAVSQTVSNLPDGIYQLKVTDYVGCEKSTSFSIATDSTEIYRVSAIGKYLKTPADPSGSSTYCELFANGTAKYTVFNNPSWSDGTVFNATWNIQKNNGKYYYWENGFWHPAYPAIAIDFPLKYPVNIFNYHNGTTYTKQ